MLRKKRGVLLGEIELTTVLPFAKTVVCYCIIYCDKYEHADIKTQLNSCGEETSPKFHHQQETARSITCAKFLSLTRINVMRELLNQPINHILKQHMYSTILNILSM